MTAEGEVIDGCAFATQVEDTDLLQISVIATVTRSWTDLWVRDTTVVTRFWVRLVLTITVAASGTTTHLEILDNTQSAYIQIPRDTSSRPVLLPAIQSNGKPRQTYGMDRQDGRMDEHTHR